MKYKARVEIRLKAGLFDPEGETTRNSLKELKFNVENVNSSKVFEITLNASSLQDANSTIEKICKTLLANPNKDDYKISLEEVR